MNSMHPVARILQELGNTADQVATILRERKIHGVRNVVANSMRRARRPEHLRWALSTNFRYRWTLVLGVVNRRGRA